MENPHSRLQVTARTGVSRIRLIRKACGATQNLAGHLLLTLAILCGWAGPTHAETGPERWPAIGSYNFDDWSGPALKVFYTIPPKTHGQSPILIVIPGARRNAEEYRDQWRDLAVANEFITLVPCATLDDYPTEYDYNLGGVVNAVGEWQPGEKRLFSAIDPLFDDFVKRFGSKQLSYDLYGHSAGGGFVHRFLLFKPKAKVNCAVAANPAFVTLPDGEVDFPFGLRGTSIDDEAVEEWFNKRLVLLLGDRDLDPRTKPLSNSPQARRQGPHVFARGLKLFREASTVAKRKDFPFQWKLEVVPNVGHSNTHMASHAAKYLGQRSAVEPQTDKRDN